MAAPLDSLTFHSDFNELLVWAVPSLVNLASLGLLLWNSFGTAVARQMLKTSLFALMQAMLRKTANSDHFDPKLQEQVDNLSKLLELQTEKTEAIRSIVENEMILEFGILGRNTLTT